MQTSLALTGLLMGLAGGPHCVAMCGAACAGIGQAAGQRGTLAMWIFQLGRVIGYSALGALAAASMQGLGWLTVQSAALRPVWTMLHVAAIVLGLVLVWRAEQPIWLERWGKAIWAHVRSWLGRSGGSAPLVLGAAWSLLPCGLLYSAVMVAAMSARPLDGAVVMALFAAGTSMSLMAGPWLWLRLRRAGSGQWGVRLAGLALALSSSWAVWMGLAHDAAPWCVSA
jgi:sulfite exporter TauE/SafE